MGERPPPSTSEVYYFLTLVSRVSGGDASIYRRIEALSPDERGTVARDVLDRVGDMERDDMGQLLILEAMRHALQRIGK